MSQFKPPAGDAFDSHLSCDDLDATLRHFIGDLGYRIEEIFPADAPRVAIVSKDGERTCLERAADSSSETRTLRGQSLVVRQATAGDWQVGRAGMQYRDLIPGRLGGRVIASHIGIPEGGPVPDYVHYHHVCFQMIYCLRGWVRVIYENQGPPFLMHAGDCVLQPPQIRHRVLECSDGLEVVEISSPAEHRTVADHDLALPTSKIDHQRLFGGQRFVFHQAASADWRPGSAAGFESRDTGIEFASSGTGSAIIIRPAVAGQALEIRDDGQFQFNFVLQGSATLSTSSGKDWALGAADSFLVTAHMRAQLIPDSEDLEILQVTLPQ